MGRSVGCWPLLLWTIATAAASSLVQAEVYENVFNVSDPRWQVSEKYPPDKSHLWSYPVAIDGWTLAHDALRGEVRDFDTVLQTLQDEQQQMMMGSQQATAMQAWWRGHYVHLLNHHKNEDDILKAFVQQRFHYPSFMEIQHDNILTLLDELNELVGNVLVHASTDQGRASIVLDQIYPKWTSYREELLPHLKAEEDNVIPLVRAYFTPREVQKLVRQLLRRGPAVETGSIVHYVGRDKMKDSMQRQRVPRPLASIVWFLILNPRTRQYNKTMLRYLETMTTTTTTTNTTATCTDQ